MRRALVVLAAILGSGVMAWSDTLVLKDGRKIDWVSIRDLGDSYEVETADKKKITVKRGDVDRFLQGQTAAPLTGAAFTYDRPKGIAAQNLLGLIVPKRDAVNGDWRLTAAGLSIAPAQTAVAYRLAIPVAPPEEYDLEAAVEMKDGDGEIILGLVAGGRQFGVVFENLTGLSQVDGQPHYSNPSAVPGRVFAPKKPRTVICAIRKTSLAVYVDNQRHLFWEGDWKKLSIGVGYKPPTADHLFLSVANAPHAVSKLVLYPRASP